MLLQLQRDVIKALPDDRVDAAGVTPQGRVEHGGRNA